jgi:hypothetical protein
VHSLEVIKNACADALEKADQGEEWQAEYCAIVDPVCVVEMAQRIEHLEKGGDGLSVDELQALGKLVRDLTGYIKLHGGIKPDPIRDDLLLQARQLLGVTGI